MAFGCGDSRVYRQNGHSFQQITKDHSLVREMADSGLITEEEMLTHPMRNVITSSISGRNGKKTMYSSFSQSLKEKERFFLCTDGVWEYLDIKDLERCLQTKDIFSAAEAIADVILSSPATDNFTLLSMTLEHVILPDRKIKNRKNQEVSWSPLTLNVFPQLI